ncbi:SEC-C domain-containing protein [Virgibacillus sp. NKC19-16]|nr:SEC-C domain-containing protein [Virgibacillus sp. NKC19-16]
MELTMKNMLAGMKEHRAEMEKKQYKKHWKNIKVPFNLHEGLNNYTKDELADIRSYLDIKNASSLKKAELINLLQETIPDKLERVCQLWDTDRFKLLTNIAENGGFIVTTEEDIQVEQIRYLRRTGLIYTGTFEGKQVLAVPEELIEPILALKNNIKVRANVKRNTMWIKLTRGILYYYGTLNSPKLVEMVENHMNEPVDLRDYYFVMHDSNAYCKQLHIDEDGFSNGRVFDPKEVKQEHKARSDIPYYPFTKQQLLRAGEPEFVERNNSYMKLVSYLTKNFDITKAEADGIAEECVYATRIGDGPNEVMGFLSQTFEFNSTEKVQAVMDKVVELMNNTREWFLKGYTSSELFEQEKKALQPLPASKKNESKKSVKVGRNDPCPCGSGKKYKKCCGK